MIYFEVTNENIDRSRITSKGIWTDLNAAGAARHCGRMDAHTSGILFVQFLVENGQTCI